MTNWPENPQCRACKQKPCGTWHAGPNGKWLSLCCNAELVVVKKPVEVSA